jgi:hypothetical protein
MMEKVFLGVILIIVLAAVVRTVVRVANSSKDSKPAACAGCPFDSKCEMQDKQHMNGCGSDESE